MSNSQRASEIMEQIKALRQQRDIIYNDLSLGEVELRFDSKELSISSFENHTNNFKILECILLGLPLPTIHILEDENGYGELLSNHEIISTIIRFIQDPYLIQGSIIEDLHEADIDRLSLFVKRSSIQVVTIRSENKEIINFYKEMLCQF